MKITLNAQIYFKLIRSTVLFSGGHSSCKVKRIETTKTFCKLLMNDIWKNGHSEGYHTQQEGAMHYI